MLRYDFERCSFESDHLSPLSYKVPIEKENVMVNNISKSCMNIGYQIFDIEKVNLALKYVFPW